MIQRYNGNIERSKLEVTQPGILKIYAFYRKLQERASGPGECTGGVTKYLSLRISPRT